MSKIYIILQNVRSQGLRTAGKSGTSYSGLRMLKD